MPLRLLHYSDVETALDDPDRCAHFAGEIEACRDADSVVVGTGDNTAPGALSLATEGRVALDFFRAVGADVDTFGNHDFDFGHEVARDLAAAAPGTWCCANATLDGERFAPEATVPHTLVETATYRVGIVGVAHPETVEINPAAQAVSFGDPVPAVRESAAALRDAGADFVVVASHCGEGDARIARETDVDAVLGGHVHDVHVETVAETVVVRPGRAARYFAEVTLGEGTAVTVHEVEVDDPADSTDGDRTTPRRDEALAVTLRERLAATGLDEVVATVADPIERTEEAVSVAESRVGNLVADALRWRAEADAAVSPTGALRSGDPLGGEVTVADLVGLAPYDDDLAVVELSGDRLLAVLSQVPAGAFVDSLPERYCSHVSGARVVYDDAAGELRSATVGGKPVDPGRTYSLAVADYLVETDHVVGVFGPEDVARRCGRGRDALVEYARENGIAPEIEGRIERPSLGDR